MSYLNFTIKEDFSKALGEKIKRAGPRAAHGLAIQIAKDTEPFVPARTKSLANRSQVVENRVIYPGPYARYLYYGKVMVDAATGKGPRHFIDKHGNDVIRFRKGARLEATDRKLKISTAVHKRAQSHWIEGSKARNMEKWERVAGRLVEKYLDE